MKNGFVLVRIGFVYKECAVKVWVTLYLYRNHRCTYIEDYLTENNETVRNVKKAQKT